MKRIFIKIVKKVYRVRIFGTSCFSSFGTTNGFFSAILQELGYVEEKVMIGDIENIWIGHPETITELKNILIIKN